MTHSPATAFATTDQSTTPPEKTPHVVVAISLRGLSHELEFTPGTTYAFTIDESRNVITGQSSRVKSVNVFGWTIRKVSGSCAKMDQRKVAVVILVLLNKLAVSEFARAQRMTRLEPVSLAVLFTMWNAIARVTRKLEMCWL
jgi:hypothetical protein